MEHCKKISSKKAWLRAPSVKYSIRNFVPRNLLASSPALADFSYTLLQYVMCLHVFVGDCELVPSCLRSVRPNFSSHDRVSWSGGGGGGGGVKPGIPLQRKPQGKSTN